MLIRQQYCIPVPSFSALFAEKDGIRATVELRNQQGAASLIARSAGSSYFPRFSPAVSVDPYVLPAIFAGVAGAAVMCFSSVSAPPYSM